MIWHWPQIALCVVWGVILFINICENIRKADKFGFWFNVVVYTVSYWLLWKGGFWA